MVDKEQNTRDGIAVMTAWARTNDPAFVTETMMKIVDEKESPVDGLIDLAAGLINVAGQLMMMLEKRGMSIDEILQHLGAKHLDR
jgi:hypothetical protein